MKQILVLLLILVPFLNMYCCDITKLTTSFPTETTPLETILCSIKNTTTLQELTYLDRNVYQDLKEGEIILSTEEETQFLSEVDKQKSFLKKQQDKNKVLDLINTCTTVLELLKIEERITTDTKPTKKPLDEDIIHSINTKIKLLIEEYKQENELLKRLREK